MSFRAEQEPTCSSSEIRGRGFRFLNFQLNNPSKSVFASSYKYACGEPCNIPRKEKITFKLSSFLKVSRWVPLTIKDRLSQRLVLAWSNFVVRISRLGRECSASLLKMLT